MIAPVRLTAAMVEEARGLVGPYLKPTRLLEIKRSGSTCKTLLKLECEQPTGSFKVRGALSNFTRRPASPAGFVTASAGNHALGVAWAAQRTGRSESITIFVPVTTPASKLKKLGAFAVDLRVGGQTFDDAERAAQDFERETGAQFIHAYDDAFTASGQGTMIVEVAEELGAIGTVIVPVGGGGMISGIAAWIKERQPAARVVAVQPEASPALSESIRLNRALLEFGAGPTLADGLAGGIGRIVFDHRHLIDETFNVPEEQIHASIRALHNEHGLRVEASGAISHAALSLDGGGTWAEPIVAIITGSNIDDAVLASILA